MKKIKIMCVIGTRPNFMKIAPLLRALKNYPKFRPILVHTGQHYDYKMSGVFFKDLNIPRPDYNLGIRAGLHGEQTGRTMIEFEKVCLKEKPDLVIVVGDVNATLASALVAAKLHTPVAHIEAGLRSFDRTMPEEINRLLIDQIADYLFVTEPSALKNLIKEGIPRKKIFYVGNIMIDTLKNQKYKAKILKQFNLKPKQYAVLTLHRPENVDNKKILENLLNIFDEVQKKIKIIYPVHPRAEKQLKKNGLTRFINQMRNFEIIHPIGYLENLALMSHSKFVMTDSGGVQEETTVLKIPCLTLRQNTERPITVTQGTNVIVGRNKNKILKEVNKILAGRTRRSKIPKYWDGHVARRIVKILCPKK